MKRTTTLSLCLLVAASAWAQFQAGKPLPVTLNGYQTSFKKAGTLADSSNFFVWNNGWQHTYRRVFTYDSESRIQVVLEKNPANGTPVNRNTYYYTHDGLDSLMYSEEYVQGAWVPHYRYRYDYDAQRNRVRFLNENYLQQSWQIAQGDSVVYTYDGSMRVTQMEMFQFNGSVAMPLQKMIWADFDQNNLPTTLTIQSYSGMVYDNYIQLRYITWLSGFDLFDFNPTSYFGYLYSNGWLPAVYDTAWVTNGKQTRNILFEWDGNSMDSMNRTDYVYDAHDHLRDVLYYAYAAGWSMTGANRDTVTYGSWDEIVRRKTSYYTPGNGWVEQTREDFFYSGLSVQNPLAPQIPVYPNPCRDQVRVETEFHSASWISPDGKTIPAEFDGTLIHTRGLNPGMYLLRLETENGPGSVRVLINP